MNHIQLSSEIVRDQTLSIRVAVTTGIFTFELDHPFMGFLWHLSQGSLKGFQFIDPLHIVENDEQHVHIVEERVEEKNVTEQKEQPKPELLVQVEEGLKYYPPELCDEGVNGTYFMKDKDGKIIGVFKPTDEEGNSGNNPKKSSDSAFVNRGIIQGEGALREVVAYKMDKDNFAGVPETFLTTLYHPSFRTDEPEKGKFGSLQKFIENDGASWDIGPGRFPVHEVHKIGVLDLRIFNNDRHGGNILMRESDRGDIELIPIDHGLSLSSTLDHAWFDWLNWSQAKQPFDEETMKYIQNIDIEEDVRTLRELGLSSDSIKTMVISSTLLKKGAAAGLTLFDVASIVCRQDLDQPSALEQMMDTASKEGNGKENETLKALWRIMDNEIAKLSECK